MAADELPELIKYTLNKNPDGSPAGKNLEDPASYESNVNIGICEGTVTVYFMISAKNYNPVFKSGVVTVIPQNTHFKILDWDGKTTPLTYTGNPYNVSSISYTYKDDEGNDIPLVNPPTWEFYTTTGAGDPSPVSMGLGVIPTEAGKYAFKGFIPETDRYQRGESVFVYFTIESHKVTLTWEADKIVLVDVNKYKYYMYYTGGQVNPKPSATNLAGAQIPLMVNVSSPTGMSINAGIYSCEAIITDTDMANNYSIVNAVVQYEIIANGATSEPPIDPSEPSFPPYLKPEDFTPGCKYVAAQITFDTPQENPYTGDAYEYGEEYYVVASVLYKCIDCGAEVNATLILDLDEHGQIEEVNGVEPNNPLGFIIEIKYGDPVLEQKKSDGATDYYYQMAQARLVDTLNLRWDITYQFKTSPTDAEKNIVAPIDIRIKVKLKAIPKTDITIKYQYTDPDDGTVKDLVPGNISLPYTGSPITFDVIVTIKETDPLDPSVTTETVLTQYIPGTGMNKDECDYEVYWRNNTNPTESGAYLCVVPIPASGYTFKLCEQENPDAGASTDHTQNFSIHTVLPDFIQFKDPTNPSNPSHKYHFRQFELGKNDAGVKTWTVSELTYEQRSAIVNTDLNPNAKSDSDKIRLSGLYQGTTLAELLNAINNPIERIKVELNSVLIYDGNADPNNTTVTKPDPSDSTKTVFVPITEYLVCTGLTIILYNDKLTSDIDSIETILYGDVDYDGDCDNNDLIAIGKWTNSFAFLDDDTDDTEFSTIYQAGKVTDVYAFDSATGTSYTYEVKVGNNDITTVGKLTNIKDTTDPKYDTYNMNTCFKPTT